MHSTSSSVQSKLTLTFFDLNLIISDLLKFAKRFFTIFCNIFQSNIVPVFIGCSDSNFYLISISRFETDDAHAGRIQKKMFPG